MTPPLTRKMRMLRWALRHRPLRWVYWCWRSLTHRPLPTDLFDQDGNPTDVWDRIPEGDRENLGKVERTLREGRWHGRGKDRWYG